MSDFKEEIERKRLLVLIKNSETRTKATSKVNQKYQTIIDTILKVKFCYLCFQEWTDYFIYTGFSLLWARFKCFERGYGRTERFHRKSF